MAPSGTPTVPVETYNQGTTTYHIDTVRYEGRSVLEEIQHRQEMLSHQRAAKKQRKAKRPGWRQ